MRKVKADLPLKVAWGWAKDDTHMTCDMAHKLGAIIAAQGGLDNDAEQILSFPDSFYESPPIGSFGKGVDDLDIEIWGYLKEHEDEGILNYKVGVMWCKSFTPGLPSDVDKDGYPK